jgi:hypothetical protein
MTLKYIVGDKLRVTNDPGCDALSRGDTEYIIIDSISSSKTYRYTSYDANDHSISACSGCLGDQHLEFYSQPTPLRTFMLRKDAPSMLKGALLQEERTGGAYIMLNRDTHAKDSSYKINFAKRELIEEQPTWFIEVFAVTPQYMTQEELTQFESFKTTLTKKSKRK